MKSKTYHVCAMHCPKNGAWTCFDGIVNSNIINLKAEGGYKKFRQIIAKEFPDCPESNNLIILSLSVV